MTDKRKKRIKAVAAELGIGHRAAANVIAKRFACSRRPGGHAWHDRGADRICTDCGFTKGTESESEEQKK